MLCQVAFQQCAPITWSTVPWQDLRAKAMRFTLSGFTFFVHRLGPQNMKWHCKFLTLYMHGNADPASPAKPLAQAFTPAKMVILDCRLWVFVTPEGETWRDQPDHF